jgi:acetylornithine deacetylase/succinyl-diaminopimelate desuccinylase-like protein
LRAGQEITGTRDLDFSMRSEQRAAVDKTHSYYHSIWKQDMHVVPRFLWNAKMRFGKTFTTYQLAKKLGAKRVLVVTFKPAVEDAWQTDLESHVDFEGWQYQSRNSGSDPTKVSASKPLVYFGSFQDLLGRDDAGNIKAKNEWLHKVKWDLVVFDEYHFGAWRETAKELFEGEEEAGSDHLYEILEKYKPLLQSDLWVICDGPVHQSGKKLVVFGVRGDTHLELTTFGPLRPLHSGHYGNWAPNPAMELAQLLSTMKDQNGKVTIKGFYEDVMPLSAMEKAAIKAIPSVEAQLKNELGFLNEESSNRGLTASINLPSLNINGLQSANVGKLSANVIPTKAIASIDLRLVAGNDWQRQQQKVINHIKSLGYYVTEKEPTIEERKHHPKIIQIVASGGYNAQKTPMDLPIAKIIIAALQATTSEQVILTPTSGGSLPLFVFEKYLNAKTISVPVANHDNNQHAENENIRLKNLFDGIETMAAIMLQSSK